MSIVLKPDDYMLKPYVVLGFPLQVFFILLFVSFQELRVITDTTAWQAHFLKGLLVMSLIESASLKMLQNRYDAVQIRVVAWSLAALAGILFEVAQGLIPMTGNVLIDIFFGKSVFEWQDVAADWLGSVVHAVVSYLTIVPPTPSLSHDKRRSYLKS